MSVHWGIVLKKSFLGDEQNFLGPLMRLASGDVRDHIVSHTTTDHRIGATGLCCGRDVKKSTFAEFLVPFDFRLLQQYLGQSGPLMRDLLLLLVT
jgi:hypothetical protein